MVMVTNHTAMDAFARRLPDAAAFCAAASASSTPPRGGDDELVGFDHRPAALAAGLRAQQENAARSGNGAAWFAFAFAAETARAHGAGGGGDDGSDEDDDDDDDDNDDDQDALDDAVANEYAALDVVVSGEADDDDGGGREAEGRRGIPAAHELAHERATHPASGAADFMLRRLEAEYEAVTRRAAAATSTTTTRRAAAGTGVNPGADLDAVIDGLERRLEALERAVEILGIRTQDAAVEARRSKPLDVDAIKRAMREMTLEPPPWLGEPGGVREALPR